jgi:hypothetical protein
MVEKILDLFSGIFQYDILKDKKKPRRTGLSNFLAEISLITSVNSQLTPYGAFFSLQ